MGYNQAVSGGCRHREVWLSLEGLFTCWRTWIEAGVLRNPLDAGAGNMGAWVLGPLKEQKFRQNLSIGLLTGHLAKPQMTRENMTKMEAKMSSISESQK